jgi:predicted metal-dependent hydrolase
MNWPPPYTLRVSPRARNISLRIIPRLGLELVLPRGACKTEAVEFLHSKRRWIEKHALSWQVNPKSLEFPAHIELAFLQRQWQTLFHQDHKVKKIYLDDSNDTLLFRGNFMEFKQCVPVLKKWLKRLALRHVTVYLERISQETGLFYEKVTFRYQKTLWGSCTDRRNIHLNIKLLFLPEKYVRYILLHELCHTKHFNHSKRFWCLMDKHLPCAKTIDRELRHVENKVPEWYEI